MAKTSEVLQKLFTALRVPLKTHHNPDGSSRFVPRSTTIGKGVYINASVQLGLNVTIGDNVLIGYGSSIGDDSVIGHRVSINQHVRLSDSVYIGDFSTVKDNAQLMFGCRLDERSVIERGVKLIPLRVVGPNETVTERRARLHNCEDELLLLPS